MHRLSLVSCIGLIGMVAALFLARQSPAPVMTANQSDALFGREVEWEGTVSRIFVSGEGLEIISSSSPEGVFQAYMPKGEISPVTEGRVRVRGMWLDSTCAYGGNQGRCVPDIDIETIQSLNE